MGFRKRSFVMGPAGRQLLSAGTGVGHWSGAEAMLYQVPSFTTAFVAELRTK
jgi:hypothetical protein